MVFTPTAPRSIAARSAARTAANHSRGSSAPSIRLSARVSSRTIAGWSAHASSSSVATSVFIDVLSELEGLVGIREGVDVELLDRDIGGGQPLSHRLEQGVILLEVLNGGLETRGQPVGADLRALALVERVRIDGNSGWQRQLPLDAVEAGGDDAGQCDIWVGT